MNTQNKNKNGLVLAASALALCLGLGTVAAATGSAAELDNGYFMIRSVDTDDFEGLAGWRGHRDAGTGNPGTGPGTGNPTDPGDGGTDPGTTVPTPTPTPPPVVVPSAPAVIVITSCAVKNKTALNIFDSVSLTWTTSREIPRMRMDVADGASTGRVPASLIRETGRTTEGVVSYSATLTHADLSALKGNLLGSTTNLVIREDSIPGDRGAVSVLRKLSIDLSGLNARCTV